ncbi:MAG: FadR/GntR family transcriptional regulator [Nitrospiraceae bacterium]|nr:FadR/GntR family transcriptional regulator [Nitrospiraceae bacterium]
MPKIARPQQLVERVIEALSQAVSSGRFGIGTKLPPEPDLTLDLGVGRSTLREAVRVLAHNGIIEVRQGDGTYVRSLPADGEPLARRLQRAKATEVGEVRRALEIEIVRLAAERRDERDIENIRAFLEIRRQAIARSDSSAALDADIAFHCAIAWATHNEVLADLYRIFAKALRRALATLWLREGSEPSRTDDLHAGLLEAIAARDASGAVEAASELLNLHEATPPGQGADPGDDERA